MLITSTFTQYTNIMHEKMILYFKVISLLRSDCLYEPQMNFLAERDTNNIIFQTLEDFQLSNPATFRYSHLLFSLVYQDELLVLLPLILLCFSKLKRIRHCSFFVVLKLFIFHEFLMWFNLIISKNICLILFESIS